MNLRYKALGELLDPSGKDRAGDRNYPVLSITMKQGLIDQSEKFKKRVASRNIKNYRIVYKNELVVGFPIDEGVLGFQTKYPAAIVSPAYAVWKLKTNAEVHIPYFGRLLRTSQARELYASKMQGAVARRRSLKKDDFLALKFPVPNLNDQIRITTLLSKVESLIAKRKKSIADLDELLKSTFLEMFGDPVGNERGWLKMPCDKIVNSIKPGASYGGKEKSELAQDELGVAKISAVTSGFFNPDEFKAVKKSKIKKAVHKIRRGDFLFSRANTIELVGACCVVDNDYPDLFLPDKLWTITFDTDSVNSQYFNFLLKNNSFRNEVRRKATGGHDSMLNISIKRFYTLVFPIPPLKLQNQFATIAEKVKDLKEKYQDSLNDLETLYGSLSQKAFKGELDLSRIPITVELKPKDIITGVPQVGEPVLTVQDSPDKAPEPREQILHRLFNGFISGAKNGALFLDDFWLEAEEKLMDFMDEDAPPLSVADYDRVRDWLFDMLAQGKVAQVFNEQENRMEIRSVP